MRARGMQRLHKSFNCITMNMEDIFRFGIARVRYFVNMTAYAIWCRVRHFYPYVCLCGTSFLNAPCIVQSVRRKHNKYIRFVSKALHKWKYLRFIVTLLFAMCIKAICSSVMVVGDVY